MTGRTLRDSRGAESPRTARGENVTRDYGGTRAGESERRRTRRTVGRKARRNILTTDAQRSPSGLPLGTLLAHLSRSPAPPLPPPSPPLPLPPPPPSALCASSCAADDLPRSIVGFFFLPFRTLTTLRVPRPSSRDRFSRARFAHYLVGSIARIAVARSLARSSIAEGEAGKGEGRGRVKKASRSYGLSTRSCVRSGSSFATCKTRYDGAGLSRGKGKSRSLREQF